MKLLLPVGAVLLCCLVGHAVGLAVMSVDLGSEFMKIAIVKPGVPMEIALNKESRRKTPVIVSMKDGERLFSDPALTLAVRYPKQAYKYMLDLLGKTNDNPQVLKFQSRFPYYEMGTDADTGTVLFKHDDEHTYSPEELLAMVLEKAREIAADFAEQPISDAVITVPAYFNQAERRAMLRAGELAGIKVLQLMNDNTAVALNYGIFRRKEFNGTAQHYMFFDMGGSSTTATVVEYKVVTQKNPVTGIKDSTPQLTIKGVGFDRNLGGAEFQARLQTHLAKLFNDQKKTPNDVTKNNRAMAKLWKEAGRVMQVLSANTDHYAQVEGLLDDQDFRAKVTREEFEAMCSDLFDRVPIPVEQVLKSSEVTLGEIKEVILMGGGTRIPKVQDQLMQAVQRDALGKSINTDEAAALGAVYQAAHLSKGFRVKTFTIREATIYPIQVEFERTKTGEDGKETTKTVKRTLFGRNNPYPQKKVMTFNKQNKDFGFSVNYGDLDFLTDEHKRTFGKTTLQSVDLSGIEDAHVKHSADAEPKGVKAHFRVDESGILTLDKVESTFEKPPPPEGEEEKEQESTLSKLGSTISNLFGGSDKETEKKEEKKEEKTEEKTEEKQAESKEEKKEAGSKGKGEPEKEADKQSETKVDDKPKETQDKDKKEEKKEETKEEKKDDKDSKDEKKDEKKENDKEKKEEKEKEKKPPKPTMIKEDVKVGLKVADLPDPSTDKMKASRAKIEELNKKDKERIRLAQIKNDLEAYIFNTQDKLYQEAYEKCSTAEEREKLVAEFSGASDWLYEQDDDTQYSVYADKLKELKESMRALKDRVKEYEERPKALEALFTVTNYSEVFLKNMKNFTGEDQPFTETEYNTLEKLITETKEWNKTIMAEQLATPLTEKPKVTVEDFARKISELDREVKYLINKAKLFKPKKKEEKDSNATESKSNETKTEDSNTTDTKDDTKDKEEIKIDVPPPPGEEETEKKEKKEGKEEEEPLQLDGSDTKAEESNSESSEDKKPAESKTETSKDVSTEDSDKGSKDDSNKGKGHDPDDEL